MDLMPRKFYDDFFDDFMPVIPRHESNMKCDIYEKDNKYHVEMDLVGFDKKDINISSKDGYLTVSAEKKDEDNDDDKDYIRRERRYSKCERTFYLGNVDDDNIDASYNNGVLNIIVPKKEIIDNKKTIEIK